MKEQSKSMWKQYLSYLDKYLTGKKFRTAKDLEEIFKGSPRNARYAIRNFIDFLVKKGIITKSQAIDLKAGVPTGKSRERSELEKYLPEEAIFIGFKNIYGEDEEKLKARKLFFKLLLFTGLREVEIRELMNQFDPKTLDKVYKAFGIEYMKDKIAVYDMEKVKIPTRGEETKRSYVALFPIELVDELLEFQKSGVKVSKKTFEPERMFTKEFYNRDDLNLRDEKGKFIFLTKIRKYIFNFLADNAYKAREKDQSLPTDLHNIVEFIQGRKPKDVGGRNYRENIRASARLYYLIADELKEKFKEILKG